ncbi:MAG TPA: CarD family transcriptional regulator, partial [Marmoricola sp.]|nr:CarD family transcriptional regulator [Marmoricola sp.]
MSAGRLSTLADAVLVEPVLARAIDSAREGVTELELIAPQPVRPHLIKGLVDAGRIVLAVTATVREAEDLTTELLDVVGPDQVALYPAWETLPHERLSPRSDTVGNRLAVLRRIKHPGTAPGTGPLQVVVAPVRSVLQPQVKGLADLRPVEVRAGQEIEMEQVVVDLVAAAYSRVDLVEKRGEFAVRGGIIDVFPPTEEHPLRVEFFGDEVDEIRSFTVADQRTVEVVDRVWAPPCRELLLDDQVRQRAAALGEKHPQLREITDKLAEGIAVEGMESLAPVLVDEMEMLTDLMPERTTVLVLDPERVRTRAHDLVATSAEFLDASWAAAASGGQAPIDLDAASLRSVDEVREETDLAWWGLSPFGIEGQETHVVAARAVDGYRGDTEAFVAEVASQLAAGRGVMIVHPGHGPAQRTVELLADHDLAARLVEQVDPAERHVVQVVQGSLEHGLLMDHLAVFTGVDIAGQKATTRDLQRMPVRRRKQIDPLELKAGDYVVHEQHGVGRFVEMRQREVLGAMREYLILEYGASKRGHPPDRLFVPADALDQVTRYVGGEQPSLDRLGGADWAKRKGRARK